MDDSSHMFHEWTANIFNQLVYFHIIKYSAKCLYVWISTNGKLESLSVAIQTPYEHLPTATDILKLTCDVNSDSQLSNDLARKLARKLNKQVFVSCNLSDNTANYPLIEKHLFEEINSNKEKF